MTAPQVLAQRFLHLFNSRERAQLHDILAADLRYNGRQEDGTQLLLEWIDRATTTMTPRRWFAGDDVTVVEVDVVWHSPRTGDAMDAAVWAIAFGYAGDKISSVSRYADVGEAVTKMGLVPEDSPV